MGLEKRARAEKPAAVASDFKRQRKPTSVARMRRSRSRVLVVDLSGRPSTEFCELVDDPRKRLGGVKLVCAGSPQTRLDFGQMAQDQFPLLTALAVDVGHPVLDAAAEDLSGSAQEHDRVEPVIEAALVRDRPRDVQGPASSPASSCVIQSSRQTHPPSASDHSLQPPTSVSTTRKPSFSSSASALDFPVPDIPVTRILRMVARLSDRTSKFRPGYVQSLLLVDRSGTREPLIVAVVVASGCRGAAGDERRAGVARVLRPSHGLRRTCPRRGSRTRRYVPKESRRARGGA